MQIDEEIQEDLVLQLEVIIELGFAALGEIAGHTTRCHDGQCISCKTMTATSRTLREIITNAVLTKAKLEEST
jgi:hypothetical protein